MRIVAGTAWNGPQYPDILFRLNPTTTEIQRGTLNKLVLLFFLSTQSRYFYFVKFAARQADLMCCWYEINSEVILKLYFENPE